MRSVCLGTAKTLMYPQGGHLWVFLNWALGFRAAGLDVVWLDMLEDYDDPALAAAGVSALRERIAPWGFGDRIALVDAAGSDVPAVAGLCLGADAATSCDLLFDLRYNLPPEFVARFRKTALLDIDPGLLQFAMRQGHLKPAPHDRYFSIGRNLDQPFIDTGLPWITVPPCVHVASWPLVPAPAAPVFTTVAHWGGGYMVDADGSVYANDKKTAFADYLHLPARIPAAMEIATSLDDWDEGREQAELERLGWRIVDPLRVAGSPAEFQRYVGASTGEFSCAKASTLRLANGWISDRTLCYLASGRPAVVQWTGELPELAEPAGLLRFRSPVEAERLLLDVLDRYAFHAHAARALAEDVFSAERVVATVLARL